MLKLFAIALSFLIAASAQPLSDEYLPPVGEYAVAYSGGVETNFSESEPAHLFADDGYRYRTVKRLRLRHRRDLGHSDSDPAYIPPAETYEVEAPADAFSFSNEGYRYRTHKRYRLRRRY